jgi:DNA-binding MarR family transcriptional regulator
MKELAERMQLTAGAVTQVVASLERQGLVERVRDPEDGRGVIVRPTLASNEGYERSRDRLAEMERRWSEMVGPRRWATFRAVLFTLAEALEDEG